MFPKFIFNSILALSVGGALSAVVPVGTKNAIAIIQSPNGDDDRVYYQPPAGTITELSTSGPFDTGRLKGTGPSPIVPATEALQGTPISAVIVGNYREIHFFFLSPDRVLSEYYWTPSTSWKGGSKCTDCLTAKGYKAAFNNDGLSASVTTNGVISVAFVSSSNADTFSEAVKRPDGWVLATLRDNN